MSAAPGTAAGVGHGHRQHQSPSLLPWPSTALHQQMGTNVAGGAGALVELGKLGQDLQQGTRGGLGRLPQIKSWSGWGGDGKIAAQGQTKHCGYREVCLETGITLGEALEPEGTCSAL